MKSTAFFKTTIDKGYARYKVRDKLYWNHPNDSNKDCIVYVKEIDINKAHNQSVYWVSAWRKDPPSNWVAALDHELERL